MHEDKKGSDVLSEFYAEVKEYGIAGSKFYGNPAVNKIHRIKFIENSKRQFGWK